jgi:hypothetical protein
MIQRNAQHPGILAISLKLTGPKREGYTEFGAKPECIEGPWFMPPSAINRALAEGALGLP